MAVNARAIVVRGYGPPDVLVLEKVSLPEVAPDEVRIRVLAAAVNHSDLEIRAGSWPIRRDPPFPYVPGLEAVGEVVATGADVDSVAVGANVVTMMQGLGGVRAERDGGYADYVTVLADAVAPVPVNADPLTVAALGLAAVTAYEGLRRLGPVTGMRVVVTGASGGVGSAGILLARALGAAEVIGVVSRPERMEYVRSLAADDAIVADDHLGHALGRGRVDRVLDTVGGRLFRPCVASLRAGGGLAAVGTIGGAGVELDADTLLQPVTITGYGSESLDGAALRAAMTTICTLLAARQLAVPEVTQLRLAEAARAHRLLEEHQVTGRIVLVPA